MQQCSNAKAWQQSSRQSAELHASWSLAVLQQHTLLQVLKSLVQAFKLFAVVPNTPASAGMDLLNRHRVAPEAQVVHFDTVPCGCTDTCTQST